MCFAISFTKINISKGLQVLSKKKKKNTAKHNDDDFRGEKIMGQRKGIFVDNKNGYQRPLSECSILCCNIRILSPTMVSISACLFIDP